MGMNEKQIWKFMFIFVTVVLIILSLATQNFHSSADTESSKEATKGEGTPH